MVTSLHIEEAVAIHNMLGEHGALWLADRIDTLSAAGDIAAVRKHQRIASFYRKIIASK